MVIEHIYENGVIVADCIGKSIQYRLRNFACHFDDEKCDRGGWCVRKSKKYNVDGARSRIMDVCPRYSAKSIQTHL